MPRGMTYASMMNIPSEDLAKFLYEEAPDVLQAFFVRFGDHRFVDVECPTDGDSVAYEDGNICLVCGKAVKRLFRVTFEFSVQVSASDDVDADEQGRREARNLLGVTYDDLVNIEVANVSEEFGW